MSDDVEVQEEASPPEPECNCGEEFITVPCPVHSLVITEKDAPSFGEDVTIITDVNLNLEKPFSTYRGHIFVCPKCGKPSIMVNQTMGEYCVACGARVRVESKVVTDYLRSLNKDI